MTNKRKLVITSLYVPGIYPHGRNDVVCNLLAPAYLKAVADSDKEISDKYDIKILNLATTLDRKTLNEKILLEKPDILAYSTYLWNYNNVFESLKELKEIKRDIPVILGGPYVSYDSSKIIKENPQVDIVVVGSGESKFKRLLENDLKKESLSSIPMITYKDEHGNIKSTEGFIREDLSKVPSPYKTKSIDLNDGQKHTALIETFRGCPFKCGYCMWGKEEKKLNTFPLEQILDDIEIIYNNPNVEFVYFVDSSLFYIKSRAKTIIEKISSCNNPLPTVATLDISVLDEEMVECLSKINLMRNQFHFGMQSINPLALKLLGRNSTKELFEDKVKLLRRINPSAEISFDLIYGLPGDDYNNFRETVDFALSLRPNRLNYSHLTLLPGSPFFEDRNLHEFEYGTEQPFLVYSNKHYSKEDIIKTVKFTNWAIAMSYYPPIQEIIHKIHNEDSKIKNIDIIDSFIDICEKEIDKYDFNKFDFTMESNNKIRREFMDYLSEPINSLKIYKSAKKLLEKKNLERLSEDIQIGIDYHKCLSEHKEPFELKEKYEDKKINHVKTTWVRGN